MDVNIPSWISARFTSRFKFLDWFYQLKNIFMEKPSNLVLKVLQEV